MDHKPIQIKILPERELLCILFLLSLNKLIKNIFLNVCIFLDIKTEIYMRVNIWQVKEMEKGFINIQMVINMKVNFVKIVKMV